MQIIYFLLCNVLLQAFCWDFYRPLLPETPFFCFLLSTVFAESFKRAADRSDALVVGAVHVRASLLSKVLLCDITVPCPALLDIVCAIEGVRSEKKARLRRKHLRKLIDDARMTAARGEVERTCPTQDYF